MALSLRAEVPAINHNLDFIKKKISLVAKELLQREITHCYESTTNAYAKSVVVARSQTRPRICRASPTRSKREFHPNTVAFSP